jgi:hypothetical protein
MTTGENDRLEQLMTEVAALRDEVEALRRDHARPGVPAGTTPAAPATASRRRMMQLAGAAAAGAVVSAAGAGRAAAVDDDPMTVGDTQTAQRATTLLNGTAGNVNGVALTTPLSAILTVENAAIATSVGLDATATGTGVRATSSTTTGAATAAAPRAGGAGLVASGTYGAIFADGRKAHLLLSPNNVPAAGAAIAKAAPPTRTDAHEQGEIDTDSTGALWYCTQSGTPGQWVRLAAPGTAGALQLLAQPKRVYDSRAGEPPVTPSPKGALTNPSPRTISCTANASGVPANARGVLLNVTIVSLSAGGFLAVTPGGSGSSGTSSLNWTSSGQAVANSVTVGCGTNASVDLIAGAGATDVIVDAFGYYL